ncbi:MAG: hypothetical protein QW596_03350 [Sulfolobales archaeon]
MQSLRDEELSTRITKSLRIFNFFIFQKTLYPDVINLLKSTNIVKLVRINELDSNRNYYILEPDTSICGHKCTSKCHSENISRSGCYSECMSICKSSVIDTILGSLSIAYKNSS